MRLWLMGRRVMLLDGDVWVWFIRKVDGLVLELLFN